MLWLMMGCGAKFSLYEGDETVNQPPTIERIALTPDAVSAQTDMLSCVTEVVDPEDDSFTLAYNWQLNGSNVSLTETLEGPFVIGDAISCTAVATDENGNESAPAQASVAMASALASGLRPLFLQRLQNLEPRRRSV